ncbi:MAG: hypothetical protein ACOYBP_05460 [Microbacteriaceae bacterium]
MTEPSAVAASRTAWPMSSVLWIIVLVIMASFQTWRGAVIDGVLFYSLAGVLVIDRLTRGSITIFRTPVVVPRPVTLAITGTLALVLIVAPRHSWIDFVVVVAIGVTVLLVAWAPQSQPRPVAHAPLVRSAAAWSIIAISLCLVEAIAFILSVTMPQGSAGFPTISVLLDPVLQNGVGRTIAVAVWLAAGLGLLGFWRRR